MSFKEWVTITAGVVTVLGVFSAFTGETTPPPPPPPPVELRQIKLMDFEKQLLPLVRTRLSENEGRRIAALNKKFTEMKDIHQINLKSEVGEFAELYGRAAEEEITPELPETLDFNCAKNQSNEDCVSANAEKLSQYAYDIANQSEAKMETWAAEKFKELLFRYDVCASTISQNPEIEADDVVLRAAMMEECLAEQGLSGEELKIFQVN